MSRRLCSGVLVWLTLLACVHGASTTVYTDSTTAFNSPRGMYVDGTGNMYVADFNNHRIVKLSAAGAEVGSYMDTTTSLANPASIDLDTSSNMYIADYTSNRVVKLGPTGGAELQVYTHSLNGPVGVKLDQAGNIYVTDYNNNRVVRFTPGGSASDFITGLNGPVGISMDATGSFYVINQKSNTVLKFPSSGGSVPSQTFSATPTPLNNAEGVVVDDADGSVYVSDLGNNRVVRFSSSGAILNIYSGASSGSSTVFPYGIDIGVNGDVIVSDPNNNRLVAYNNVATVAGDPQFVGFQNQKFQFHGIPDACFALFSTPSYYVNSHFTYLESAGSSATYNDTEPFTHPGTYMDQLAIVTPNVIIRLHAGPHQVGMTRISLNDEILPVGSRLTWTNDSSTVYVPSPSQVWITLDQLTLKITNSDHFFNLETSLNDIEMMRLGKKHVSFRGLSASADSALLARSYPRPVLMSPSNSAFRMHGLLGQTWRHITYADGRFYEGDANDYLVPHLLSPAFAYSLYMHTDGDDSANADM